MQHEGSFHLNDVRPIKEDAALRVVLGLKIIPDAHTLGLACQNGWHYQPVKQDQQVKTHTYRTTHCPGDYEQPFTL